MDARQKRSQVALHRAIIDLATARDVSSLTVSEITDRAGVNRSTFYAHATSAAELLCAALAAELDAIRDEYLDTLRAGAATDSTIRQGTARILGHLETRRDLYLRAFDAPGGDSGVRPTYARGEVVRQPRPDPPAGAGIRMSTLTAASGSARSRH